ncbi:hypothetical protein ACFVWL_01615 [Microbacterium sp. NPDC058269]|uniref:hypothetical protein n=1 Tax=Microbacterium sp. NPDC058269 TaxID=3346414 RepID=UPI0036D914AA
MFYFSERALNEIDDGRLATSTATSSGSLGLHGLSFGRSRALAESPGARDQVDFALKRARKSGRGIRRDGWSVQNAGEVFDLMTSDLHVGIMPFMSFGHHGEMEHHVSKIRAFWATATLPAAAEGQAGLKLIMVGSRDNVVNKPWSGAGEDGLEIGFDYPSDPGPIGRLLSWELELGDDDSIQKDIRESELWFGAPRDGEEALRASWMTDRARSALIRDEGYAQTWERRRPFSRARVTGIARDIWRSPDQENILLARPVLIQDMS